MIHVNSVDVYPPDNPPVAVHGHFRNPGLLAKGQVRQCLLCSGSEGLFPLRGVYIGQADFELLVINENGQGIAIGNLDDFALVDCFGRDKEGGQQQEQGNECSSGHLS